ncbi:MAG: CDP-diacylglycerol--glycerol-3-phosphate 3-phosphatidyltransferase [Bacilli bacterium]|nr:CDP-diacylglycerol--glycerol-3-phosphate 3-phosphatidyltransferase [Bacilli bacterium]
MNLPNKITMARIVLSIMLIIFLIFPFDSCGVILPKYQIGVVSIELKYIIGGVVFLIASLTDSLDGYLARSRNLVTDFGKVMDAIADKMLVNGILIVLACNDMINVAVPVIIITRDIAVDSIKMVAGQSGHAVGASILGKLKTICMMSGLTLVFFANMPFEFIGINVADGLVYAATVLSIISGIQYYSVNKDAFKEK